MPSPNSLTIASAWPDRGVCGLVFDMRELCQLLGVRTGAADEENKAAFRRLAKQLHPNLHSGDADTERRLQDVLRAYETLSDRASRMAFDAGLFNQRSMRRRRFRANAMTGVAVCALTVSVGLHWRVLSETLLPTEDSTRLAGNKTRTAMLDKAGHDCRATLIANPAWGDLANSDSLLIPPTKRSGRDARRLKPATKPGSAAGQDG